MPAQSRVSDIGSVSADAHGCPACPHGAKGPIIVGSPNVNVNGLPCARVDDVGVHAACCGPNMFTATKGSGSVFVNGKKAHRGRRAEALRRVGPERQGLCQREHGRLNLLDAWLWVS